MKKRLLSLLLILCMVLAWAPGAVSAEDVHWIDVGGGAQVALREDRLGLYVCGVSQSSAGGVDPVDIEIPATTPIFGRDHQTVVVGIDRNVFDHCESLTTVVLPPTLNGIGQGAFSGCSSLRKINIPPSIREISENTFDGCADLEIDIPATVRTIRSGAFENCYATRKLTLNPGLETIEQYAFYYCTQIPSLTLPSTIRRVEANAFRDCHSLSSVTISAGASGIAAGAFEGCGELRDVFYQGTRAQWDRSGMAAAFPGCTIHCLDDLDTSETYTVTFNARGGAVSPASKTVTNGQTYGTLPTPVYNGHTFEGWYTQPEGGMLVQSGTPVSLSADQTLYARWVSTSYSHTVHFDANGGTVSPASKEITWGNSYGALPTPTREGYSFAGWFTARSGGEQVAAIDTFTADSDQTLYAHWEELGRQYTVTLDPAGGTVAPASVTVTSGQAYGTLPTPVRRGWTFTGWYTAFVGGSQVTASARVTITANQTLYARWEQDESPAPVKTPTLAALSYSFSNSAKAFGYTGSYRIPLARYQLMYGHTQRAQELYNQSAAWGGSCFGMSSTSNMFFQEGNQLSPGMFRSAAERPSSLRADDRSAALGLTLREFMEAMQVGQQSVSIQRAYRRNLDDLAGLCRAVQAFHDTGVNPVVIDVFGLNPSGSLSGHAIVGYDIVEVSATESRLMVYDCNYPNQERYITLRRSGGQYTSWSYSISSGYPTWSTGASRSYMTYIPYSAYYDTWTHRGADNNAQVLLQTNAANFTVSDAEGSTAAVVRDGQVVSCGDGVYPIIEVWDTADGQSAAREGVAMWLPADLYTVSADGQDQLEATMVQVAQAASVRTSASSVTLAVDDTLNINYVSVDDAQSDYDVSLRSSLDQGYSDVQISGSTTASAASVGQVDGTLYAGGDLEITELVMDGAAGSQADLKDDMPQVDALLSRRNATPFTDVSRGSWFYDAVRYVYQEGLMTGSSAVRFDPDGTTTRAQIVTILYRLEGEPGAGRAKFSDVADGQWYASAIAWANANGIVNGYSDGRFGPNDRITREQLAAILYNYAQFKGYNVSGQANISAFRDAGQVSAYALTAVRWANRAGLLSGTSAATLSPRGTASRAQVATLLMRFCQSASQ